MLLRVKGNSKSKAKDHLKKLNLNGERSVIWATFPKKKFPDQNKEEAVNNMTANIKFLDIYLSTRVINDEVSNLFPPFFWTSS